eukprot:g44759.t1
MDSKCGVGYVEFITYLKAGQHRSQWQVQSSEPSCPRTPRAVSPAAVHGLRALEQYVGTGHEREQVARGGDGQAGSPECRWVHNSRAAEATSPKRRRGRISGATGSKSQSAGGAE